MKILVQNVIPPFELCVDKINLLVVENNRCFYKLLLDLYSMSEGSSGSVVISEDNKLLKFSAVTEYIYQLVPFEFNSKKLLSKLYSKLSEFAVDEILIEDTLRITSVIRQYVSKLVFSSEFELVFSDEIDISTLLKILGVRFESSKGGLCEKLFDYFCVIRELYGERLFIVSNLFPLVDEGELQLFFKTVVEHDMMLLLIENADFSSDLVNKIVVDKDFCVI